MDIETRDILDLIIDKWSKNELAVYYKLDEDKNEVYTVVVEDNNVKKLNRRSSDRIPSDRRVDTKNVICIIKIVKGKRKTAHIFHKSNIEIDIDYHGIYEYIEKFLALIKSKIRQVNRWGIKVKLGTMTNEEFIKLDDSFIVNKEYVINELFNKEISREV